MQTGSFLRILSRLDRHEAEHTIQELGTGMQRMISTDICLCFLLCLL